MAGTKLGINDEGMKKIARASRKQPERPAPKVAQEESSYPADVLSIAEDIKERWKNGEISEIVDAVHEDVDGSQWIIYYGRNMDVLQQTRNEDAISDAGVDIDTSQGWRHILTQVAYFAMEADVYDALRNLGWDGMDSFEDDEEEEEEEEPEEDEEAEAAVLRQRILDSVTEEEEPQE